MKCCIEGCENEVRALGLCSPHYARARDGRSMSAPIRPVVRAGSDADRLKSKTILNEATGCWEWAASFNTNGYGQFRFRGTTEQAHRAAWMIFHGEIPAAENAYGTANVLHRCDNPKCVNPDHLFLGDQGDNANDAVSKGRWGKRGCVGESHGRAILTDDDVRVIRSSSLTHRELAERYGISKSAVRHIKHRRTWKHIT